MNSDKERSSGRLRRSPPQRRTTRVVPKEPLVHSTIRLPAWMHRALTEEAEREERSLHQQILYILKQHVGPMARNRADEAAAEQAEHGDGEGHRR